VSIADAEGAARDQHLEMDNVKKKRQRILWGLAILGAFLVLYVGSYWAWSRWCPGRQGDTKDGRHWYTFVVGVPDWEYTLFYFYYPLVRIDAAWCETDHKFDMVYL